MKMNRRASSVGASVFFPCAFVGAMVLWLVPVGFCDAAQGEGQSGATVKISVDDPRPVAKAIEELEKRYKWIITYEDLRYVHESEIKDVTEESSRHQDEHEPGEERKILVPKGGTLSFSFSLPEGAAKPDDPAAVVQALLDASAKGSDPVAFRLVQSGTVLHVVPAYGKNESGAWVARGAILDEGIDLPEEERSGYDTLKAICQAVSQALQTRVAVGTVPANLFRGRRVRIGASREPARDVLLRLLQALKTRLTWQIFYGPDGRPNVGSYAVNIHSVAER